MQICNFLIDDAYALYKMRKKEREREKERNFRRKISHRNNRAFGNSFKAERIKREANERINRVKYRCNKVRVAGISHTSQAADSLLRARASDCARGNKHVVISRGELRWTNRGISAPPALVIQYDAGNFSRSSIRIFLCCICSRLADNIVPRCGGRQQFSDT